MENVSGAGPKDYRGEWHYWEFLIGMGWNAQVFLSEEEQPHHNARLSAQYRVT